MIPDFRRATIRPAGLALLPALLLQGCLLVPWPHRYVANSRIAGTVVDDETSAPLEGIHVHLGKKMREPRAVTGPDGRFAIEPEERWRIFIWVPLLPIDAAAPCTTPLILADPAQASGEAERVRTLTIEAASCPHPFFLGGGVEENREIRDDLGTIRLKRIRPRWMWGAAVAAGRAVARSERR